MKRLQPKSLLLGGAVCLNLFFAADATFAAPQLSTLANQATFPACALLDIDGVTCWDDNYSCQGGYDASGTPLTPVSVACSASAYGDPIRVFPGIGNLPASIITLIGNSAIITNPLVIVRLTPAQRNQAIAKLMSLGFSREGAKAALKNLDVTYVIIVKSLQSASGGSDGVSNQASSITHRSKGNTLTLNNLAPGARNVTWRVEISTKNPAVFLGKTKNSSPARFTIGSSG